MKDTVEPTMPTRLWTVINKDTKEIVAVSLTRQPARDMRNDLNRRRKVSKFTVRGYTADAELV
jgi:hypothetical protein